MDETKNSSVGDEDPWAWATKQATADEHPRSFEEEYENRIAAGFCPGKAAASYYNDTMAWIRSLPAAPATPEAETIRSAVNALPTTDSRWCRYQDKLDLFDAYIIDEQHLRARLQALRFGKLAQCMAEFQQIVLERALAHEEANRDTAVACRAKSIALIKSLQARPAADRLAGCENGELSSMVLSALILTECRIERLQNCQRLISKAQNACDIQNYEETDAPSNGIR
jgi:hypothetical protein